MVDGGLLLIAHSQTRADASKRLFPGQIRASAGGPMEGVRILWHDEPHGRFGACMTTSCRVLLAYPRFNSESFWGYKVSCEVVGARHPAAPLGLITLAAMLPQTWEFRLVDRNTEELTERDILWADIVMTGGMLFQRVDSLKI